MNNATNTIIFTTIELVFYLFFYGVTTNITLLKYNIRNSRIDPRMDLDIIF